MPSAPGTLLVAPRASLESSDSGFVAKPYLLLSYRSMSPAIVRLERSRPLLIPWQAGTIDAGQHTEHSIRSAAIMNAEAEAGSAAAASSPWSYVPPAPMSVADTGIPEPFLRELALKTLWAHDKPSLAAISDVMGLHTAAVDEL